MEAVVLSTCSAPSIYEPMAMLFCPEQSSACTPRDRTGDVKRVDTQLHLDATTHFAPNRDNRVSSHLCSTVALLLPPITAPLQHGGMGERGWLVCSEQPQNSDVLPEFTGQQRRCVHSGQTRSHSDVFPQLFRLQSCLKDFSCFWNRGKKKTPTQLNPCIHMGCRKQKKKESDLDDDKHMAHWKAGRSS